ncbi:DegT/DnrJ/EryC1/StrS family aminotransferase [Streptomyces sp. O3]
MGTVATLRAAGVGPGDEVIVPAYGNVEMTEAVVLAGALPVFADVDPATYCLDPGAVAAAVTSRTAAVIAIHRFGHPADMRLLGEVGRRHGLLVLERADGVETSADEAWRRAHAGYFDERLTGGLKKPAPADGHTYQQYVVRVPGNGRPDRDAFARAARARGVDCRVPVKTPVHRLPDHRRRVLLPETERAADETLSLPVGAALAWRDLQRIVSVCNRLGGLLQPAC